MVGVSVSVADDTAFAEALKTAANDRVISRLREGDATLWGAAAEPEASVRLAWTDLIEESKGFLTDLLALRDHFAAAGLDHVVLCGMGGSSLAPEVICRAYGVELTVVDTSQPDMIRGVLADRIDRTVVVVSSKSGSTVETDSLRRVYAGAFEAAGINPAERIVVVTDPGSPLESEARADGYRVFPANPNVGGRYSALTAFGLVPSALAGADVAGLLDDAAAIGPVLWSEDSPGLSLGLTLGLAHNDGVDKLVLVDSTGAGLGDWIEQLVAESTGKESKGLLPVVVAGVSSPEVAKPTSDSLVVAIGSETAPETPSGYAVAIAGSLGAQFLVWEVATAIAGRLIGINPFDQPDVESAKAAARELLGGSTGHATPDSLDEGIELFGSDSGSITTAVSELLDSVDPQRGYLSVQAYLDRLDVTEFSQVRDLLAARLGRPVTFGWGPRFLHSTGQFHKGGAPVGVFLQITTAPDEDLEIPGRDFTLGQFCDSQAGGDAQVLRGHGRPVLRLHLSSSAQLSRIREALA